MTRIVKRQHIFTAITAIAVIVGGAAYSPASNVQVKKAGNLTAPADAALMAFCTDPIVAQVLSQDFRAARRSADADAKAVLTLTVTVTQDFLKPGVSMGKLAPGDPQVADLIKAAGATPPPIGDTGNEADKVAVARELAQRQMRPSDSPMQQILNEFQGHGDLGPPVPCSEQQNPQPGCVEPTPKPKVGSPDYRGDVTDYLHRDEQAGLFHKRDDSAAFDTVVVARAALTGSADELTVVAVIHPGSDVTEAKKLVAEEIANAILH